MLDETLDGVERHHRIHGSSVERQVSRIALEEPEIGMAVRLGRVRDRLGRDVDTDDRTSRLRQQRRAVSLSRGHVQHVLATTERPCQTIAMQILDLGLASGGGGQALLGPFQRCVWNDTLEDLAQLFEFPPRSREPSTRRPILPHSAVSARSGEH